MISPVLQFELIRAGRGRLHWILRVLYVGILLFLLHSAYGHYNVRRLLDNGAFLRAMKETATTFYFSFTYCQLIAVIILSPVASATSLAEEKSRRTLEFILASPLYDAEIVGSKLILAVFRVWEIVLAGLPFCALCILMGGLSPGRIFADFAVAMAAAWFACCLSMFAAVWMNKLTETLLLVYFTQFLWYTSYAIQTFSNMGGANLWLPDFIRQWNAFLVVGRTDVPGLVEPLLATWEADLVMFLGGLAFAVAAWFSLRPSWNRSLQSSPKSKSWVWDLNRLRRPRPPVPVSDDPMLWRELQQRRTSAVERIIWVIVAAGLGTVFLVSIVYWDQTRLAMVNYAGGAPPVIPMTALLTNLFFLGFFAMPCIAVMGANVFAEEHTKSLFDGLRATLLTQFEIVHAKARRLLRGVLQLLCVPFATFFVSTIVGFSTVVGTMFVTFYLLSSGLFMAMAGMYLSLRCKKLSHAVIAAVLVSLSLNWLVIVVGMFLFRGPSEEVPFLALSVSPTFHSVSVLEHDNTHSHTISRRISPEMCRATSFFYGMIYLFAAWCLYQRCSLPIGPWSHDTCEWNWNQIVPDASLSDSASPRDLFGDPRPVADR